jgi:hypothetical protein
MAEQTYVGGRSFLVTRAEGSQGDLTKYGVYDSGGTDDKYLLGTNFTSPTRNNMNRIYSVGGGRSFRMAVPGRYEVTGTMEYEVQNAKHMRYPLGSIDAGTLVAVDLDNNAIAGATTLKRYKCYESTTLDSYSLDQININDFSSADLQTRYYGCKVNQLTVRADTDAPLHATFDWVGQREEIISETASEPSVVTYLDTPPMFYRGTIIMGGSVDHVTNPGKVTGGTTYAQINSLESTMVNNLESYFTINSTTGRGNKFQIEKQREYTLRFDMNFTNLDQVKRFYDGTTSATKPMGTPGGASEYTPFLVVLDYKTQLTDANNFKQLRFIYEGDYFDEKSIPITPMDMIRQEITAFAKTLTVYNITSEAL